MDVFEQWESNVRSYCRTFSDVYVSAKDCKMVAENGKRYIDFFAGAGALNYGHNNTYMKRKMIDYLENDGVIHGLDMFTTAKRMFIEIFQREVLAPNDYPYKMQFCGPTGTNAVEAGIKLARKVTGRTGIFSFMGGFHGMSLGSLALTGNLHNRAGAGIPLSHVTFMPYPHGFMDTFDTIQYMETVLSDENSGVDKPAAIIFETVQAEGGVIVAPIEWMRQLSDLCKRHDILLICDDIQAGCGRTGTFFSFERAGIVPDLVILSKSISGYGLPMSLVLMKPELDIWNPGEHNGTFRGNQLAFIGGTAALEYRKQINLEQAVKQKADFIDNFLNKEIASLDSNIKIRGIGMIWGIDVSNLADKEISKKVVTDCYEKGIIIERAGRGDTVIKIMPPLNIEIELLLQGMNIIKEIMQKHCAQTVNEGDIIVHA
ncbi:diaminobutyrate--2-oxoglutarate transaminase [Paenibacillus glacialis]|uniref:Diaminobutyrate--2-oxoglutarate transaminase n=1 Tax=Paenibacillus glacialis TaxID=494026 RepID=A0A168JJ37_9BACL|nr:diaminobutyrate--2-oxoglutarate transaminase [Paenibacillus glacialis]OAB40699.1 diaminobutyrate--2-oxoglutarate transaminase [Paenibacillus glacialis]